MAIHPLQGVALACCLSCCCRGSPQQQLPPCWWSFRRRSRPNLGHWACRRTSCVVHFGGLRGLNAYKDVGVAIVVGRPALSNIALEMQTEALHMYDPARARRSTARPSGDGQRSRSRRRAVKLPLHPRRTQIRIAALCRRSLPPAKSSRPWRASGLMTEPSTTRVNFTSSDSIPPGCRSRGWPRWDQANVSWERIAQLRGLMLKAPEMNQAAHPDLVAQKGRGGDGSTDQRAAWLAALTAHLATFLNGQTGGNNLLANPYKKIKEEGVEIIRTIPQS